MQVEESIFSAEFAGKKGRAFFPGLSREKYVEQVFTEPLWQL